MAKKSQKTRNLHGKKPATSRWALLLIDVMNDLEFSGGEKLVRRAGALAKRIVKLADRARHAGVPVLYVNDNFGQWQSDFSKIIEHCSKQKTKGCGLAQALKPSPEDYFILKPEKSAFYQTPLALLLDHLEVETLILAGLTTDSCIFMTACDAHMRDFHLKIPKDCVAAIDPRDHEFFLRQMEKNLQADIRSSSRIAFTSTNHKPSSSRKR